MATANFTGHGQQKTVLCSTGLTAGLHGQLTFLSVLNSFLSVSAFLGNSLILIALHEESSLHPPSKLLLRNLATADLCVGLISEPLAVTYWMSVVNGHWKICRFASVAALVAGYILSSVSVLTMTTISVDRLLALLLGLRYRQVVTLKRTFVIVIISWLLSSVFSAVQVFNFFVTAWYCTIAISLGLLTSIFSYTKIFFTLRRRQNQVQGHVQQPNQTNQLNIARYKKAVSTAIWLQLTLVACYLPHGVATAFVTNTGLFSSTDYHAQIYTATLVFFNSSLNPILCCWKLEEVRQEVKDTIRQVLCHIFST